jgi:hypothetical protein
MRVVEKYIEGKYGDDRCEDKIAITPHYVAVIDGATSKTMDTFRGKTSGWIVAFEIANCIEELTCPNLSSYELIIHINQHLLGRTRIWGLDQSGPAKGSAGLAVYCAAKREITVVADIQCLINGELQDTSFEYDKLINNTRSAAIHAAVLEGKTLEEIAHDDVGGKAIKPLRQWQHLFQNTDINPWGFGVLNGSDEVLPFVQVFHVGEGDEVILATDGYPNVRQTLKKSEAMLAQVLLTDPLMYFIFPSSKGLKPGMCSFDDRAYVRFIA